jgi:hypothetical protein
MLIKYGKGFIMTEHDDRMLEILDDYKKVYDIINWNDLDELLTECMKSEDDYAISYIFDLKRINDFYCVLEDVKTSIYNRIDAKTAGNR